MTWQRWEYTLFGRKGRTRSARELVRIVMRELYRRDPEGVRRCAEERLWPWLGTRDRLAARYGVQEHLGEEGEVVVLVQSAGEGMIGGELSALFRRLWYREGAFSARLLDE